MKTPDYIEGPEATERFNKGMTRLLRVSKDVVKDKPLPKLKESVRKARKTDGKG
jgi:hypothetical protein